MKLSELWLREWVKIEIDSKALSEQITMAGLEVDSIEPVAGTFSGVIIGEITECNQCINADRFYVTKINIGSEYFLNIICSASNCRQGLKVAVATTDAVLPNGIRVKKSNLRGKLSEGMLCSYYDLGISEVCRTIIELPMDAPIGTDIREYMKLDDNTIEINLTPNRADCLSIIGIARDVAAINQTNLNTPEIKPTPETTEEKIPISVDIPEICPRYLGRIIKNINVKVSTPLWMREKLRRCGIHLTDSVITDIINYVLIELGQPMNAFDKSYIEGDITVRMAKENESIVSQNNKIKINTDTAVVSDRRKVLAIGGICVSEDFCVNEKTQDILLECAFFNPLAITNYARCYGLNTEASYRYERGVDPLLQYRAMERATELLSNICGGEIGPLIDVTNESNLPKRIAIMLHRRKLDRLIGHYITSNRVKYILHSLGCEVTESYNTWNVIVPSWRFDIKIEEDLVEEIARIYGYNNIPSKPIQPYLNIQDYRKSTLSLKRVKNLLNDKGYQEVITYSFVDPKVQKLIHPDEEALFLPNPISIEMSAMRLSLWTGLLKTVIYNQSRQQNRIRIFETGFRFSPDVNSDLGVRQDFVLSGIISGNRYEEHWDLKKSSVDFYDMKGDLESVFDLTGRLSEFKFSAQEIKALHPGQSAAIYLCNECIGFIGIIHPEIEHKLNLSGSIAMFELEWNKISDRIIPRVQEISRFPSIRRDISVVVNENIPAADILDECKKIDIKNHVVSINLFDVYRGEGIAKNYKSLAIRLIFQDSNRTLKEEEVSATVSRYIEALKARFQASLRK